MRLLWPRLQGARDHKETLETDSNVDLSSLCGNMPRLNAPGQAAIGLDRWLRFVVGNKYESHFP
jgi:hypothetical protein